MYILVYMSSTCDLIEVYRNGAELSIYIEVYRISGHVYYEL
jgi:hypothetical protein